MSADFASLLGQSADEIEKPKPLPMGTFTFQVGEHRFDESAKKKTPFVEFKVTPKVAQEDVDEDLLAEVKNWQEREMRLTYYLTDDAIWRLKDFLEHCGISTAGRTLGECVPETAGALVNGYVKHDVNGEDVYANISSTSVAE
jgi:hypothetical protein